MMVFDVDVPVVVVASYSRLMVDVAVDEFDVDSILAMHFG